MKMQRSRAMMARPVGLRHHRAISVYWIANRSGMMTPAHIATALTMPWMWETGGMAKSILTAGGRR